MNQIFKSENGHKVSNFFNLFLFFEENNLFLVEQPIFRAEAGLFVCILRCISPGSWLLPPAPPSASLLLRHEAHGGGRQWPRPPLRSGVPCAGDRLGMLSGGAAAINFEGGGCAAAAAVAGRRRERDDAGPRQVRPDRVSHRPVEHLEQVY